MPVLNTANKVFVGSSPADAVYLGGTKVWSSAPPIPMDGLMLWLDPAQLGLADGAYIDTWPSAVGSLVGTNLSVAPNRPVLRASALNGNPVARFIPGSGLRWPTIGLEGEPGLNWTIIYVGRIWNVAAVGRVVSAGYPPTNVALGYHGGNEDKAYVEGWLYPDLGHAQTTNWKLYTGTMEGVVGLVKGWFYSNGVFLSGDHAVSQGWGGSTFHLNGYNVNGAEETTNCEVAEVLMWTRRLPDAERQDAEGYMRDKYGPF